MDQRTILITGVPRSGSTWQYNVVRLALEQAGHTVYGAWKPDYDVYNKSEYHIIKIHGYDAELAKKAWQIFTSIRNPFDIVTSLQRRGTLINKGRLQKYIDDWSKWWMVANYITEFRSVGTQGEVWNILKELGIACKILPIVDAVNKLKPPTTGAYDDYDKVTLLHPNHY